MLKPGESSASEPAARRSGAVWRKLRYVWLKGRYDSFGQLLLDGFNLVGLDVNPYRLYLEGLPLLGRDMEAQAPRFEQYSFKLLQRADIPFIASLPDRKFTAESLLRRLDLNCIGLGAWLGDDLAAFVWCDLKNCHYKGHRFALKADEGYLFDVYALRPFRGKGLAPQLRWRIYVELARMGRTTLYSISHSFNGPAVQVKKKLNAQILDSGITIGIFRRWRFSRHIKGYRLT